MDHSNAVPNGKRRATAVIAVHGVGDQKPFETARKIGDLLQELAKEPRDFCEKPSKCANPGPEQPRYFPFREQGLRINVNPVVMRGKASAAQRSKEKGESIERVDTASGGTGTRGPFNSWVQEQIKRIKGKERERRNADNALKKKRRELKKQQEHAEQQTQEDASQPQRQKELTKNQIKEAEQLKRIAEEAEGLGRTAYDARNAFYEVAEKARTQDLATVFMKGQLECYGGDDPEDTYETLRLEGERAPSQPGEPQHDVHIYELYWADLSRLKAGIFSIFTELYQLLFHLSSLGTHTVNAAMLQHLESNRWRWFRNLQSWSSVTLAVPLPIINVLMLGIVAVVAGLGVLSQLGEKYPNGGDTFVAVTAGAVITIGLGALLWKLMKGIKRFHPGFLIWIIPLGVGIAASISLGAKDDLAKQVSLHLIGAEALILSALATLGCWAVLNQYNKRRPGLWPWTWAISISVATMGVSSWYWCPGSSAPLSKSGTQLLLRIFESAYGVLVIAWAALFILVILTWGVGMVTAGIPFRSDQEARSRWTGMLLLSMPTLMFLAVTITGWAILAGSIEKFLPALDYTPFLVGTIKAPATAGSTTTLAKAFLDAPLSWMLPLTLAAAGIAALPAIWSMVPVVWTEVVPPAPHKACSGGVKRLGPVVVASISSRLTHLRCGSCLYIYIRASFSDLFGLQKTRSSGSVSGAPIDRSAQWRAFWLGISCERLTKKASAWIQAGIRPSS